MKQLIKYEFYSFIKSPIRKIAAISIVLFLSLSVFAYNYLEKKDIQTTVESKFQEYEFYKTRNMVLTNLIIYENDKDPIDVEQLNLYQFEYNQMHSMMFSFGLIYGDIKYSLNSTYDLNNYYTYLDTQLETYEKGYQVFEGIDNIEKVELEKQVVEDKIENNQKYYISSSHLSGSNYVSNLLSGYSLLIIFVLLTFMNNNIFAVDFEEGSYKTVFSSKWKRKQLLNSKLLFSFLTSFAVIIIGLVAGILVTSIVNGFGSFGDLSVVSEGYESFVQSTHGYQIITNLTKSIQCFFYFIPLLVVYLCLVHTIAITTKSTSATYSIVMLLLLVLAVLGPIEVSKYLSIPFGLFAYDFNSFLYKDLIVGFYFPMLTSLVLSLCLYYLMYLYICKKDL